MKQRCFILFLVAIFLAFAPHRGWAGAEVPIKGRFAGTVQPKPVDGTAWTFRLDNVANGQLSHLGKVEAKWVVPEVTLNLESWSLIISEPDWSGTITAANGDQIFGEYSFVEDELEITSGYSVQFTIELRVTGGTGRFEGATGHAIASGTANLLTLGFVIDLQGSLSNAGSSRK